MIRAPGSRAGGYLLTSSIENDRVVEHKTFTCQHCNRLVIVKHKCRAEDLGGRCFCCGGLICAPCTGKFGCDNIEKKLERAEARYEALRSYGLI
jgi:hypothetical protein